MKSYEYRAFAVAAPDLLNSLPDNTRSCDNLSIFLGKLIIVSMAIFISVLIQLLFYYLFNCFGMLIFTSLFRMLCKAPRAGLDRRHINFNYYYCCYYYCRGDGVSMRLRY